MFCPNQIICIDSSTCTTGVPVAGTPENLLLLAEVIQMVPERGSCWARPLAIAQEQDFSLKLRHDLREAPQLILPAHLFREAVDTEVLPLMTELFRWDKSDALPARTMHDEFLSCQALHDFIDCLSIRLPQKHQPDRGLPDRTEF